MKKILIFAIIIICFGCQKKCDCQNKNCGPGCKLQCEENRCTPGTRCCDKCSCDPLKK